MKKIRIGNDLTIRCAVTRRGADEDFTGKTLALLLRTSLATVRLTPTAEGSTLAALFPGKEQTRTGKYTLTLVEDTTAGARYTADAVDAFALVPTSAEEGDDGDLTGAQTVELDLDVSAPASGLSAYELALLHGYTGTEDEFVAALADHDTTLAGIAARLAALEEQAAALEAQTLLAK